MYIFSTVFAVSSCIWDWGFFEVGGAVRTNKTFVLYTSRCKGQHAVLLNCQDFGQSTQRCTTLGELCCSSQTGQLAHHTQLGLPVSPVSHRSTAESLQQPLYRMLLALGLHPQEDPAQGKQQPLVPPHLSSPTAPAKSASKFLLQEILGPGCQ